jgi:hypothetical protein
MRFRVPPAGGIGKYDVTPAGVILPMREPYVGDQRFPSDARAKVPVKLEYPGNTFNCPDIVIAQSWSSPWHMNHILWSEPKAILFTPTPTANLENLPLTVILMIS